MNIFPWYKIADSVFIYYYKEDGDNEAIDIVVGFSENCIRFGIRQKRIHEIIFPEPDHWFTIDLSTPKTIGNDILNIPIPSKIIKCDWKLFFQDFVMGMENNDSIFAESLYASKAREKLNKSIIYRLIAAKQKFIEYAEMGFIDEFEYNKLLAEYSDLLMHPQIISILPSDCVGTDKLLDNPEYELQKIFRKRIKISAPEKDKNDISDTTKRYQYKLIEVNFNLNENIREKIQNFFLHRHATICAYYSRIGRSVYWITWLSMLIWSVTFIRSCIFFNYIHLENYILHFLTSTILIIGLFVLNNNVKYLNHNRYFPRIIIALIASWLLIAFSDDFIVSQLFIKDWLIWSVPILSFLIIGILYFESREFSPYYCGISIKQFGTEYFWTNLKRACNLKILPIFSFSLFASLCIGVVFQFATFDKLIESSNILPTVIYGKHFLAMEKEKERMQFLLLNNTTINVYEKKKMLNTIDLLNSFTIKYYNADSLLKLICKGEKLAFTDKESVVYKQYFKDCNEKIASIRVSIKGKEFYLFPRMLIFHSFIVLLIAFIVQIIISGKTVTEGLKNKTE